MFDHFDSRTLEYFCNSALGHFKDSIDKKLTANLKLLVEFSFHNGTKRKIILNFHNILVGHTEVITILFSVNGFRQLY